MLKAVSRLEVKIGERTYLFFCENDSPMGEVHDALFQMKALVIQKMQEIDQKKEDKSEVT